MQKFLVRLLAVLAACSTFGVAAAEPRISATIESSPVATMTADEKRALSIAAGRILRHVYDAKVELEEKEQKMAAGEIAKAIELVGIIEAAVPDTETRYRISAGEKTYEDSEIAAPEIVPIYSELDRVSLSAPLQAASDAKRDEAGDADEPESVKDEKLDFVSMSLEMNTAKSRLAEADAALREGKSGVAKAALLDVLGSVRFSLVTVDLPLERAQDNLMLAKAELESGNKAAARKLLAEAADAIDAYAGNKGQSAVAARNELRDEIKAMTSEVNAKPESVLAKIENWWDRIGEWMRR